MFFLSTTFAWPLHFLCFFVILCERLTFLSRKKNCHFIDSPILVSPSTSVRQMSFICKTTTQEKKQREKNREINAGIRHYKPGIINQMRLKPRPFPLPCQTIPVFARLFHVIILTSADRPHQHRGPPNAGQRGGRSSEHPGVNPLRWLQEDCTGMAE